MHRNRVLVPNKISQLLRYTHWLDELKPVVFSNVIFLCCKNSLSISMSVDASNYGATRNQKLNKPYYLWMVLMFSFAKGNLLLNHTTTADENVNGYLYYMCIYREDISFGFGKDPRIIVTGLMVNDLPSVMCVANMCRVLSIQRVKRDLLWRH